MYKDKHTNKLIEDYQGEIRDLFLQADTEANDIVDVLYDMDRYSLSQIELWRNEWVTKYPELGAIQ